jgi:hypothetical protein
MRELPFTRAQRNCIAREIDRVVVGYVHHSLPAAHRVWGVTYTLDFPDREIRPPSADLIVAPGDCYRLDDEALEVLDRATDGWHPDRHTGGILSPDDVDWSQLVHFPGDFATCPPLCPLADLPPERYVLVRGDKGQPLVTIFDRIDQRSITVRPAGYHPDVPDKNDGPVRVERDNCFHFDVGEYRRLYSAFLECQLTEQSQWMSLKPYSPEPT